MIPDQKADTPVTPNSAPWVRHIANSWLVVILAILILVGSFVYDILDDRNTVIKNEQQRLLSQARVIEVNLEQQIESIRDILRSVALEHAAQGMQSRLTELSKAIPGARTLIILDKTGNTINSNRKDLVGRNFKGREYFSAPLQQPSQETLYVSPPFHTVLNTFIINLSIIIPDLDGSFNGIVGASLDPDYFSVLLNSVRYSEDTRCSIIHGDGLLFMMVPEKSGDAGSNVAVPGSLFTRHLQNGKNVSISTGKSFVAGGNRIVAMRTFNLPQLKLSKPLIISVSRDLDTILVDWRRDALLKSSVLLVFSVFLLMGTYLVLQRQRKLDRQTQHLLDEQHVARNEITRSQELQKNYERLELMQEVAQYHATNVQELLDYSLEKVISLTESRIGYIYHYSEDKKEFVLNTWSKDVMASCRVAEPQSLYQLEKTGIWGEVVRQRTSIIVNDFSAENPLKKGYPEGHVHLSRFMSIPIFDADIIVAVVGVANKVLPYDQTDLLQLSLMMEGVWKIATRLKLEKQISRAGHEWQSTFDSINDSIALIDANQTVLRCNLASSLLLGREFSDVIGQPCWKLFHNTDAPIDDCPMGRARLSHVTETSTINHQGRWLEITVDPILSINDEMTGAVHVVRDITERKQAEESLREMQAQMMQNDKLATIGQLAAGVAHEINNPMGFVGSNMTTLAKYIEKYNRYIGLIEVELRASSSGELPEHVQALRQSLKLDYVMRDISVLVDECNEGIDRIKRIVQDLRTFSRADNFAVGNADLNSCMESTINIVINEIKYVAELQRDYGELPKVSCNSQQINQVFMNLLINAAHAIQAKGDEIGEITIRTWCDHDSAFVSVSDTGCGIAPENQSRIFDAFYTTKDVGKGTGLGLSISAGIIRKHDGEITLSSEVGVGTTFTIRLPLRQSQKTAQEL